MLHSRVHQFPQLLTIKSTFLPDVRLGMKKIHAKYFFDWTTFNRPSWLLTFDTLRKISSFFDTRWHTLVNVTFSLVVKVCLCVFEQITKKNSKLVYHKPKYEKFWSVF